jgi:hypothetical protein
MVETPSSHFFMSRPPLIDPSQRIVTGLLWVECPKPSKLFTEICY